MSDGKKAREFWVWPADDADDDDCGVCFKTDPMPHLKHSYIHVVELLPGHRLISREEFRQAFIRAGWDDSGKHDYLCELKDLVRELFGEGE